MVAIAPLNLRKNRQLWFFKNFYKEIGKLILIFIKKATFNPQLLEIHEYMTYNGFVRCTNVLRGRKDLS